MFLTVVSHFGQCRGSAAAWLWSIVRNEVANYFRCRKESGPLDPQWPDPSPDPPTAAADAEMQGRLHQALEQLPEERHQLVYMKFFLDMANVEIASACGLNAVTVGVRVHRVLKELRALMSDDADEGGAIERS